MYTAWIAGLLFVLQFSANSVLAADCAAEANFQGCKSIQETVLKTCGPVDYPCQCKAQILIRQCYDLCPTYAAEAASRSAIVDSICAVVPPSSSSILPSASVSAQASVVPPRSTQSTITASAPTSSTSNSSSFAYRITPFVQCAVLVAFLTISVIQLS